MFINKRKIGSDGEQLVVKYLKKHNAKILECNYNTPVGEIDIVARQKDILLFVEVKSRSDNQFGYGREAVNYHKQRHIVRTAQYYLAVNNLTGCAMRFDVAEVDLTTNKVSYFEDAFRPQ